MRLSNFLVGMLACAAITACSNDTDSIIDNNENDGQLSYVAINIVNANADTRITNEQAENGTEAENGITSARFYLFDAIGNPYTLTNSATGAGSGTNYVDVTINDDNNPSTDAPNVEKIIKEAVLVFRGTTNKQPASIVAVLNVSTESLGSNAKSLNDLTGSPSIANYGTTTANNFVMSNSVYASGNTKVVATNINGKIAASETEAKENPVDIYVERAVAKVSVTFGGEKKSGTEDTYKVSGDNTPAVYAQVKGWAVTTDCRTSNLLKNIDPSWTNDNLGFTWNDSPFYRSYWAVTPESINPVNDKSYNDIIANGSTLSAAQYCQENTKDSKTNLIVVAQLQDEDGDANPIYKYFGVNYTSANDIFNLICSKYQGQYYTYNGSTYDEMDTDDLEFKATGNGISGADYEAVPQVKSGINIYTPNASGAYDQATITDVNAELATNPAQVAPDGYVYYFTPIRHLANTTDKTGAYGVVRNHVYKITVDGITGFGTTIFDPNKNIVPTLPKNTETFIAARINVLSWRIVSNSVTLGQ